MRLAPLRPALFIAGAFLAFGLADLAIAQQNPFGGPRPPMAEPASGIGAWLLAQQAAFHKALVAAFRHVERGSQGQIGLLWLAFLYGVFHAIGPGHGKAVIASYIVANENAARRGIALAFAAAFVQALVALGLVLVLAIALGETARTIDSTTLWLERIGFTILLMLGAAITITKLRALFGHTESHACAHDHATGTQGGSFLALAIGAGLRPCTGAVILLVFALSLGQFLIGALAVGVMATGTAIGTSFFALLAVKAKHLALRLAAGASRPRLVLALEALAGLALMSLALLLLTATISAGT